MLFLTCIVLFYLVENRKIGISVQTSRTAETEWVSQWVELKDWISEQIVWIRIGLDLQIGLYKSFLNCSTDWLHS